MRIWNPQSRQNCRLTGPQTWGQKSVQGAFSPKPNRLSLKMRLPWAGISYCMSQCCLTKRSLLPFSYHMCREEVAFGRKGKPNIPEPNIQKAFGTRTFSRTGRERTEEHRTAKGPQTTRRTQKTSMPLCTSFSDSVVCQRKNSLNTSRLAHLMPQGRPAATDARRAQRGRVPRTRRPRCAAAPP